MKTLPDSGILVEAEGFDNFGGWVLDSQFELVMGSPYLLAHGNGTPVADGTTVISILYAGEYNVWVRAKDWLPDHHPGRFCLKINETILGTEFGADGIDWNWQYGGSVKIAAGDTKLGLHDLTGFCGRCDAIFFSYEVAAPPEAVDEAAHAWRRLFRGLPDEPIFTGTFDVIVVGGGMVGTAAALTAARLGDRVALVHDRPVIGDNGSVEIGLSPRGERGPLVKEIMQRHSDGDLYAMQLLDAESEATVFLEHTVYNTGTSGSAVTSIDARHARSGREIRLSAPIYIDCSGKAILGIYSGAETLFGQESQAEYGESLAPTHGDEMHHGNTLFFRTRMADSPITFPHVPWATQVAKNFSDLGGQLITPGIENGPGPKIIARNRAPDPTINPRMRRPNTHFWEYGQWLDPYKQAEHIRDHLLCALYGTFSNVKTVEPDTFANLEFDWVAHVPGQGEFRRYKGQHVLTETDTRSYRVFKDAVVKNDGAFCLHYPDKEKYDFRLKHWIYDERDGKPYDIPFRSLYSVNISNLMMAGKHISMTHVAGSSTKFMGNGAQHAIATAAAAHICKKYTTTPSNVYRHHLAELQGVAAAITSANKLSSHL